MLNDIGKITDVSLQNLTYCLTTNINHLLQNLIMIKALPLILGNPTTFLD